MKRKLISLFLIFSMLLCIISCDIDIPVYAASSKMENAINLAISIANDDSHGYSMSNRWGPDYDCSSFVISALKYAGYNVGSATYTGDMKVNLTARGFVWIPWSQIGSVNNLQRGDILLNEEEHTEIYLGNGYNVGAHSSRGNPQSGDQTGTEVSVSGYYYHPWDGVLREQNRMLPGTIDSGVKTPFTQTASKKISTYDEYGNIESNHYIDPGDSCTILEVYTNGFVKVQYPVSGGTRCAYAKREDFSIMNESNCPSGYTIKSTASIYGCQKVTVTVEPYDSGITNYKLYFIRPDGSTITVDLGTSNTLSAYANNLGTWKVYAEVSNGSGSYCGSINDGCVSFNVTAPDMGSKVDLGTDFVAYIANSDSGNVLSNDGDNVSCRTNTSEKSQQWLFRRKSDGSYEIESLSGNGKCLDAYSGKGYQGDNVQVYKGDNETLQSWNLYSTGDGSYYLMPACSNSAVLNIDGSINLSGVNVNIWSYNQSAAQKFLIKKLEDTTLSLSSRSVDLDLNGINTATISVSADGVLTSNNYFTCSRDTSVMSTTWGARNGNTNELTLKGKKTGTYTIYVSLIDGYTLETLNEESITVRITCSHNYGSWNTTKPATCTENGEKQRECSVCGKIEKKTIYTGGHMKVAISAVAPTCTTNGKTEGIHCVVCGEIFKKQEIVPATGHKYSNWYITKEATCTSDGVKQRKCSVCGEYETKIIEAKGHEYCKHDTTSTCEQNGTSEYVCTICGDRMVVEDENLTVPHMPELRNAKKATSLTDGYTGDTVCKICGKVIKKGNIVPKISSVSLSATSYTYDGKVKTPTVTVKDRTGKMLKKDKDYTVTYQSGRINTGTYKVTITYKGNYSGNKSISFIIVPGKVTGLKQKTSSCVTNRIKMSWEKIAGADGYVIYRSASQYGVCKYVKTVTTTTFSDEGLKAGSRFYYKVRAYKILNGKKVYGDYSSTKSMVTKPGAPTVTLTAETKSAKITWTRSNGANGYEIYMATSKNGNYTKITTTGLATMRYTKTGLKKGQKYYIKARSYITLSNGSKIYSGWSQIKSVTVK